MRARAYMQFLTSTYKDRKVLCELGYNWGPPRWRLEFLMSFPAYILPRRKGQRSDKRELSLSFMRTDSTVWDYDEFVGRVIWTSAPFPGFEGNAYEHLLLLRPSGDILPCYRKCSPDNNFCICQAGNHMALRA
jgi:hypothetical protein